MKNLLVVVTIFAMALPVGATMISADADGYGNGIDISTVFSGITLSSVGGYAGLDGVVYSYADGLASTGSSVFANNLSFQRQWYSDIVGGFALRADFDQLADSVSIDIIGDDSGDLGTLSAYNSSGQLLGSVQTPQLDYGQVFNAVINRPSFDIAYIIAGGAAASQDTVHLDNLTANIPEPTTLGLLMLGGLIKIIKWKRKD